MGQRDFLAKLGFIENPFQSTNADEEEHLQTYFVPPPYFHSVWGDPDIPSSQVIFAPRGGGKSAQRRMIEYNAISADVFVSGGDRRDVPMRSEKLRAVGAVGIDGTSPYVLNRRTSGTGRPHAF